MTIQRPALRVRRRIAGGSRVMVAIADFPFFGNISCRKTAGGTRLWAPNFARLRRALGSSRARFPGEDTGPRDQVVDFALAAAQRLFGFAQHLALHQNLDHALVATSDDQVGPFALAS